MRYVIQRVIRYPTLAAGPSGDRPQPAVLTRQHGSPVSARQSVGWTWRGSNPHVARLPYAARRTASRSWPKAPRSSYDHRGGGAGDLLVPEARQSPHRRGDDLGGRTVSDVRRESNLRGLRRAGMATRSMLTAATPLLRAAPARHRRHRGDHGPLTATPVGHGDSIANRGAPRGPKHAHSPR